jgi:hypothetical protein
VNATGASRFFTPINGSPGKNECTTCASDSRLGAYTTAALVTPLGMFACTIPGATSNPASDKVLSTSSADGLFPASMTSTVTFAGVMGVTGSVVPTPGSGVPFLIAANSFSSAGSSFTMSSGIPPWVTRACDPETERNCTAPVLIPRI